MACRRLPLPQFGYPWHLGWLVVSGIRGEPVLRRGSAGYVTRFPDASTVSRAFPTLLRVPVEALVLPGLKLLIFVVHKGF